MNAQEMLAPDGTAITHTSEIIPGTCGIVNFDSSGDPNFSGEKTAVDWDNQESKTIAGVVLVVDDGDEEWLLHHLIPAHADPLDDATLAIFRTEMRIGRALDHATALRKAVDQIWAANDLVKDDYPSLFNAVSLEATLRKEYERAKAKGQAAKERQLDLQDA